MNTKLAIGFLILSVFTKSAQAVSLPTDFSTTQGTNGLTYELIGDVRATNTLNPGPPGTSLLSYIGVFAFNYPGVIAIPTYASVATQNYPNLSNDMADGALVMSPGTGGVAGTSDIGVAVSFQASTAGMYNAFGHFARDNPNFGAGDGVDVLVIKGANLNSPLFSAHISQNHAVDYTHPFAGTGIAPFNLTLPLLAGDLLRFIVFSGPQGQDGSFDNTALQLSVVQVPEPSSVVLAGMGALILFGAARRHCRRCSSRVIAKAALQLH